MIKMLTKTPSLDSLPLDQYKQIEMGVWYDDLKKEYTTKRNILSFDIDKKIEMWLKNKAYNTQRMYRLYLNTFLEYLEDKSILSVDAYELDRFILFQLNKFSSSKARLMFSAISSFYSDLVRWRDIDRNPCKGSKFQREFHNIKEKKKILPTEEDLDYMEMYFDKNTVAHKKMRLALYIMRKYGVRIGIFDDITYENGVLGGTSKGKYYSINVEKDEYILQNKNLLEKLNSGTIHTQFNRVIKKLFEEKIISIKFSPHDYRLIFSINFYEKTKDIYRLKELLNHSDSRITENYLRGMEIKI
jgi:site-specific recombinase XerD